MENNVNNNVSNNVVNNINPSVNNNAQPVVNGEQKKEKNVYVLPMVIIGIVLLIALGLLVFLLTGSISSRNKLVCTLTTKESGFTRVEETVYRFEDNINTSINHVYTLTYDSIFSDDEYEEKFDGIINNNSGVTQYGFGTQISKDENVITITAYSIVFNEYNRDMIKSNAAKEGYVCK